MKGRSGGLLLRSPGSRPAAVVQAALQGGAILTSQMTDYLLKLPCILKLEEIPLAELRGILYPSTGLAAIRGTSVG